MKDINFYKKDDKEFIVAINSPKAKAIFRKEEKANGKFITETGTFSVNNIDLPTIFTYCISHGLSVKSELPIIIPKLNVK